MREEKKSRNPFHGLFSRSKGKPELEVPISETKLSSSDSKSSVAQNVLPEPVQIEPTTSEPISQKSLWEQAAEKVDPKIRQALHEIRGSPIFTQNQNEDGKEAASASSLPELVTHEAQRRLEDMEHRQWALPIGVAGKTIEIRSLLSKLIAFAKVVKDKGDAFIDLDPTGYAKLAWLPFSLFVDLSAKELEQHQAALDAFSETSFLIYRYAQVESIYHKRKNKEEKFEECLVDLYKAVLDCEVALLHHFCRHGFLRFLRAIPAVDGWQDRVTSINHLDQHCQALIDIHVATDILDTRRDVDELVEAQRREEINNILQWIIDHDPLVQRKLVLEKLGKTYSDIGRWLFEHDAFTSWLEDSTTDSSNSQYGLRLLWMHGPVGCGKSSLITRVIEHFLEQNLVSKHHNEQVSYFYCAKTHGLGSKPIEIFQSMVRQLAWSRKDSQVEQCIKDEWKRRQASKTDRLSLDDCKTLLLQLIPRLRKTILIIDALDECDDPRGFLEALDELSTSFQERKVSVNIFLSSRDDVYFAVNSTFSEYLAINITSGATGPDLRQYIERRVDEECKHFRQVTKREDSSILQRLVDELTDRGQLAFRWTELQLALFFPSGRPFNPIEIKRRLEKLKDRSGLLDLNNTYKEVYEHNISESFTRKDDLHFLLKWVLACTRNAHIRLLTDAIKFHLEQQGEATDHIDHIYILDLASNLLVIDEHDTIQFAHISVKEYFQVTADFASKFTTTETNNQVAETCLQYLLSSYQNYPYYSVDRILTGQMESEFFHYSLARWALHYSKSGETRSSTVHFKKLIPGASASNEFAAWVEAGMDWHGFNMDHVDDALSTPPCPFFLSCIWGFMGIINETIDQKPEQLKALNFNGRNGLHLAAYYNQRDVVKALIRTDIDINLQTNDKEERTALQQAVIRGNTEIVRILLLERDDVDVNIRDRSGDSAIHHAIKCGLVEMIRLLLDCSKNLNINLESDIEWESDFRGLTPLHLAITKGHSDIVTMLLEKRNDIQINFDSNEGSPLHVAAKRGYVDIIDVLFRKRDDINIHQKDESGRTALHLASMKGHVRVVTTLLQKDGSIQVNDVDEYGLTALHYAAQDGHAGVVQVLLDERDDLKVNIQDSLGYTALHWAATNNHVSAIENLLRECENIQVNTKEVAGRTALHLASEVGNAEAISALLMNSVSIDADAQDTDGCTALHLACRDYHSEAVKALLEGCEDLKVNIKNKEDETALHLAVKNYRGYMVDELATNPKVDPNIANNDGQTALHIAASMGNFAMIESLLRSSGRIQINARNDKQQTALHLTLRFATYAEYNHAAVKWRWRHDSAKCVRVLLQHGIDTTSQDGTGKTTLYIAAEEDNSEAFAMILASCMGANLNEQDESGWTMLHWAVHNNEKTIVEQLIQKWPDCVNFADKDGRTALHIACSEGHLDLVQALLGGQLTIDINTVDNLNGYTALHYAIDKGLSEIVQLLLDTRPDIDINLATPTGRTAIQMAILEQNEKTLQVLLDKRKDIDINHVDYEGATALLLGALSYQARPIFTLLENRADLAVNAKLEDGRTVLHVMLETGVFLDPYYRQSDMTDPVVRDLLEKYKNDVEVNARDVRGRTVCHVAAQFGRFGALKMILKICHNVDLDSTDKDGRTILHYTAARGHMNDIVLSLDSHEEADPESDDEDTDGDSDDSERKSQVENYDEDHDEDEDENPGEEGDNETLEESDSELDDGTDYCDEMMDLLLKKCTNATINGKDNRGLTAFHLASLAKDGGFVEKLLSEERRIDVNAQDDYGWTALHFAVFYRCTNVVKTLLTIRSSINTNIQDQKGQTPLHLAASKGRVKLVKALLDNGRDMNLGLKDEKKQTALDLALEGNYGEVVNMLKAAIGQVPEEGNSST